MKEQRLIREAFEVLAKFYGRQNWWPGESPFEVAIGAILVQRTSWRNVVMALERLRKEDMLNPKDLAEGDMDRLALLIRPAGFPISKARRVASFCRFLSEGYGGSLKKLLGEGDARTRLLSLDGIGDETADSILLYAGERPYLPIGAYTRRTLTRIGLKGESYRGWQRRIEEAIPKSIDAFKEFHALFVIHGKSICRAQPRCWRCPLREVCNYGRGASEKGGDDRRSKDDCGHDEAPSSGEG